jgi:hypothetical protein
VRLFVAGLADEFARGVGSSPGVFDGFPYDPTQYSLMLTTY